MENDKKNKIKICTIGACIVIGLVGLINVAGCQGTEDKAMSEQEVVDLLKFYIQGRGADDIAGPKLKAGGERTKRILINILEDPTKSKEVVGTTVQVLHIYFPSDETYDALDRFAECIEDPDEREKTIGMMKAIRAMPRDR